MNSELLFRYSKAIQNKPGFQVTHDCGYKIFSEITNKSLKDDDFALFCNISCCGKYFSAKGTVLERTLLSTSDILYFTKGSGMITCMRNGQTESAQISETGAVLLSGNAKYIIKTIQDSEFILLSQYGMMVDKYYDFICGKKIITSIKITQVEAFLMQVDNLFFYVNYNFRINKMLAISTLTQLLSSLYMSSLDPDEYNVMGQPNWINQALIYMEQNYMKKITVEKIAENCKLSTSHFSKLFRDYTGITPYDYLKKIRLTNAKRMLLESDNLVKQISIDVGMPSVNHFIVAFKEETGMSPEVFREKNRKKQG